MCVKNYLAQSRGASGTLCKSKDLRVCWCPHTDSVGQCPFRPTAPVTLSNRPASPLRNDVTGTLGAILRQVS